jgi:hypothetical protein
MKRYCFILSYSQAITLLLLLPLPSSLFYPQYMRDYNSFYLFEFSLTSLKEYVAHFSCMGARVDVKIAF